MKRHPRLLDLSRDHYTALKLARDAKRAAESADPQSIAALAGRVVADFAAELDPHFREEEGWLLETLARTGRDDLVQRTRADHGELRRLAKALEEPEAATLLQFAELLTDHVRFEERELFEVLQGCLEP